MNVLFKMILVFLLNLILLALDTIYLLQNLKYEY
jgi:hypothetical protein